MSYFIGYRTLCFASADLDLHFYEQWSYEFVEASTAIDEREKKIGAVAEKIEQNLRLVAVTAIEDKLQDVRGLPFANFGGFLVEILIFRKQHPSQALNLN